MRSMIQTAKIISDDLYYWCTLHKLYKTEMFSLKAIENCKHCDVWKMLRNRKKKALSWNLVAYLYNSKSWILTLFTPLKNTFLISSLNTELLAATAKKDWQFKKRDNLTTERARMLRLRGFS